jgi:hypothetical protein
VRLQELLEITHLALVSYKLPDSGEVVPLLQIVPSKSNEERLLVDPELVSVLATDITRLRPGNDGAVPLVARYDDHERTTGPRLPHLFQRAHGARREVISPGTVYKLINTALAAAGLKDATGQSLAPRREARNELKPATAFRIAVGRTQFRRSGPARSVTSTRTMPSLALTATVTLSPLAPEPLRRTELPKISLTSKTGDPCPLRPSRKRHGLPNRPPSHHRTRLPRRPRPRENAGDRADTQGCMLDSAAHVKPGYTPERVPEPRQAATHTAPWPQFPSAIRPWTAQHADLQRYKVTHPRTETKQPVSQENPASGHIRRWWQVMGSNHRRLSRPFYRPLLFPTTEHSARPTRT